MRDEAAQGGGAVITEEDLRQCWKQIPEAFVLHDANRSPVEFLATLAKGLRHTGEVDTIKPNRYLDVPTPAPPLIFSPPFLRYWGYRRHLRRFHRAVGVGSLIDQSQELLRARVSAFLCRALESPSLRGQVLRAAEGIPVDLMRSLEPGWDAGA